eukprot:COSAG02_NODE_27377_length_611_cov_0.886719_1_plen_38_part_01
MACRRICIIWVRLWVRLWVRCKSYPVYKSPNVIKVHRR